MENNSQYDSTVTSLKAQSDSNVSSNKVAPLDVTQTQMEPFEVEDVPQVKPSLGLFHVYAFSLGMGLI
jgi:hypothetical protein